MSFHRKYRQLVGRRTLASLRKKARNIQVPRSVGFLLALPLLVCPKLVRRRSRNAALSFAFSIVDSKCELENRFAIGGLKAS
jgi:hypothetical protein